MDAKEIRKPKDKVLNCTTVWLPRSHTHVKCTLQLNSHHIDADFMIVYVLPLLRILQPCAQPSLRFPGTRSRLA